MCHLNTSPQIQINILPFSDSTYTIYIFNLYFILMMISYSTVVEHGKEIALDKIVTKVLLVLSIIIIINYIYY